MFLNKRKTSWGGVVLVSLVVLGIVCKMPGGFFRIRNLSSFVIHEKPQIMITSHPSFFGEMTAALKISDTLADMGYGNIVVISENRFSLFRTFNVDFAINLRTETLINPKIFNFLVLHYMKHKATKPYDAILSVIPEDKIQEENNVQQLPICPFFFSAPKTDFYNAPKKKLFLCGTLWDKYRRNHCAKTYKLLDQTGYFEVYGAPKYWNDLRLKSYNGLISNEKGDLLRAMQKAGVALVLHSDGHFNNNTTTARIFEALAASNVIICDRLPFIVENFGNTVLYVDRNVSPEELFKQIDNHMQWILSHQEEAIDLAKKSHKIFIEKFSLEMILQGVIDFYLQQKNKKTEKKLTNS